MYLLLPYMMKHTIGQLSELLHNWQMHGFKYQHIFCSNSSYLRNLSMKDLLKSKDDRKFNLENLIFCEIAIFFYTL